MTVNEARSNLITEYRGFNENIISLEDIQYES